MCIFSSLMKSWVLVIGMWFSCVFVFAQYPAYFNYTIENGGPSNEVYSILQDKQGYIWVGCDAGLYRFNGVRFEQFSCPELTARSVTGLCQTSGGTIYGYNFNGQILRISNGKLVVLKGWNRAVNQIAADNSGSVWVSSGTGLFCISDRTKQWREIKNTRTNGKLYTNGIRVQQKGTVTFMQEGKLVELTGLKKTEHPINLDKPTVPVFITDSPTKPWAFRMVDGVYFYPKNKQYFQGRNKELTEILRTRKITNAQQIGSDFWISTHSGIVKFNLNSGSVSIYYPQMAFSSCLKDKEGSYWFTTLHDGILRMPNLNYLSWNERTGACNTDQFSHVIHGGKSVFFATTDGDLGEIRDSETNVFWFQQDIRSDLGALYYDSSDACIYFNKMNTMYRFCGGKAAIVNHFTRPIKDFLRIENSYLVATSQGTYLYGLPQEGFQEKKCVLNDWSRQLLISPFCKSVFVATNHGLCELSNQNGNWKTKRTFFYNKQITAVAKDQATVFVLTFEGKLYRLNKFGKESFLMQLDDNCRGVQMQYHREKLFMATNNGLLVYALQTGQKTWINRYSGLSSNNISGCVIAGNYCWLSTGKGIHKLPLKELKKGRAEGRVILKQLSVNGKRVKYKNTYELSYSDDLKLQVDGLSYRSNGNFNFAYRFQGDRTGWIEIPSSVKEITIPRLPIGSVIMEIKLIDHEERCSVNRIFLKMNIRPPFWQQWWFYLVVLMLIISVSYLFFKRKIKQLRARQEQRLKHMQLENELRLTQQNALKAQMNPHFLFNVLNSIKGYIYENDKKNATRYLSDFSNLVRKVLNMSSLPTVSLADELETLSLYINLESMLLQDDFDFEMKLDPMLDTGAISIPSLLLQPYVENAFKHGLRHKKGKKQLILAISKDSEHSVLVIRIQDNGIGRKAAAKINDKKGIQHTSFATGANQKRIELLNFEKEGMIGVVIQDLFSETGDATGTLVTINIHLS